MAKARFFSRRNFLIGSAMITGGVAFGVWRVGQPHDNPLLPGLPAGAASFNPWVKIDQTDITLITPHMEMGQGVTAMQALLIAEELDLEPGQFRTEPGPPDAAYHNTALGEEGAPFLPWDQGMMATSTRAVMGTVLKVMGLQITGGSSSVPDSFDKLRKAGAMARETLKQAAAQMTGVPVAQLRTAAGAVVLPDGRKLRYQELATVAAGVPPVEQVSLRPPEAWRLIGKLGTRPDVLAKSTGTQPYGLDVRLPGMVFATVRLNPRRGGGLRGFDAEAAKAMPGVIAVVPVTGGAAVVARTTWQAFQAADALRFDWLPAPYPPEQAQHWAAVEAAFAPEFLDKLWIDHGKPEAATGTVVQADYRAPYVAHQPLEPLNATIHLHDGKVDLWVAHQIPRIAQDKVADILGLPPENVTLHQQSAGGSFGHRLEFENIRVAAEIARQMPGQPVQLVFQREEDFAQDFLRPLGMGRAKGVVTAGKILSLDITVAAPSVIRSQMGRAGLPAAGPDKSLAEGVWTLPYDLPNLRVAAHAVPELAPVSSWRSVGASMGGFFAESLVDELLLAAGLDPLQGRIDLCAEEGARRVLSAVKALCDWQGPLGNGVGRGVAIVNSFGVPMAEVVEVEMTPAGIRLREVWAVAEVGRVVDPVHFTAMVQGGVIWGLGHAINAQITHRDGMAEQRNYDSHPGLRLAQTPVIHVKALESGGPIRGIGEPPVPPAAPALANAIFAATGQRLRAMPFDQTMDFV